MKCQTGQGFSTDVDVLPVYTACFQVTLADPWPTAVVTVPSLRVVERLLGEVHLGSAPFSDGFFCTQ